MSGSAYSVPVVAGQLPDMGRHFRLEPDEPARAAIAQALGIVGLEAMIAELDVKPLGGGRCSVRGEVVAVVTQIDVVTLEPVRQEVREAVDVTLVPAGEVVKRAAEDDAEEAREPDFDVYERGRIDVGAIAVEHLALGLDPYPRSEGVEFSGYAEDETGAESPFAKLAALKPDKPPG